MPHPSVLIIGAGITGLSTAFHLAEKGAHPITLLDKSTSGSGSSSRSGAINTMLMPTPAATQARAISFDLFERFDRILDNYAFHQVGCLGLYSPKQFAAAARLHPMQRQNGARFEILRQPQIASRFPDLQLTAAEYGVLDLRGGYSEPDRYIPALSAIVRQLGVDIREHCSVADFIIANDRVTGVRLKSGETLAADATVCTVNAWTTALLQQVDQPLPARNFVHERYVTAPFDQPPRLPAVNDDANGIYFRPTEDHRLLLGTGAHEAVQVHAPGPDIDLNQLAPDPQSLPFILDAAHTRLPLMEKATIDYHRVGLVSYPIDFVPIIGPLKALDGLYLGAHFCSGGFGYHPVAGQLLAEYIVDGQTSIDASDFSPDRFKDVDAAAYLAQDITHQQMLTDHATRQKTPVRQRH